MFTSAPSAPPSPGYSLHSLRQQGGSGDADITFCACQDCSVRAFTQEEVLNVARRCVGADLALLVVDTELQVRSLFEVREDRQ